MIPDQPQISVWLQRIQAEYRESPGLQLTRAQAQRLWSLDPPTCETLLSALVQSRFLRLTARDTYVAEGASR
jgi:hypothetical protein